MNRNTRHWTGVCYEWLGDKSIYCCWMTYIGDLKVDALFHCTSLYTVMHEKCWTFLPQTLTDWQNEMQHTEVLLWDRCQFYLLGLSLLWRLVCNLPALQDRPLVSLHVVRQAKKKGEHHDCFESHFLPLVVFWFCSPLQENSHIFSHLWCSGWSAIAVLHDLEVKRAI